MPGRKLRVMHSASIRARSLALLSVLGLAAVAGLGCAHDTACRTPGPALDAPARAGRLERDDGVCVQTLAWPQAQARGVVVVVHGLRDHASRYEPLARALARDGYAVYSHDLRGHGHSGGRRQRFDSIEQLVDDVHAVVLRARTEHPGAPLFLYGHSLGGLVTTHYALRHPSQLDGMVLSGPALALLPSVTRGQIAAARLFGTIAPNLPAQPLDDSEFVSTPQARRELAGDPLIDHDKLPARSAKAAIVGIEAVQQRMAEVSVPFLVMHGDTDKATNIEGSRRLHRTAKSPDKTLQVWEGQYHDLLHEPRRQEVIELVLAWLDARAPGDAAQRSL